MKTFKQILSESNSDYFDQFRHRPDDDDDDDSHGRSGRSEIHDVHEDFTERSAKLHEAPFSYETPSGKKRRLTFSSLHHAMNNYAGAKVVQMAAHNVLAPDSPVPEEQADQIAERIHNQHEHFYQSMLDSHLERSRDAYRRDPKFKAAADKLLQHYSSRIQPEPGEPDMTHDDIYRTEFEDRMNKDHIMPHTVAGMVLHQVGGEDARQQMAQEVNGLIMKHGGSIGVIIENPVARSTHPRVEHL